MWIIEFAVIALLGGVAAGNHCCSNKNERVLWNLSCSDGENVTLQCSQGIYFIDSSREPEKFLRGLNGSITLIDEAEPDEYCISPAVDKHNTSSNRVIALVCFPPAIESVLNWIFVALMIVSIPFLLLTLLIYLLVPPLRDLNGKCIIGYVGSLSISYMSVISMHIVPDVNLELCAFRGIVVCYSTLSSFAWLNLVTFNVWKSVRNKVYQISDKKMFMIYLIWSVSVPIVACLLVIMIDYIFGDRDLAQAIVFDCWFIDSVGFWLVFASVMGMLITLNIIMFVHSCWVLWRGYRDPTQDRIRFLRFKCVLTLRLFLISGVPWIFEVVSYTLEHEANLKYFWFIVDCINSAQGIITFLILVVFSKRVLRAIQQRKLCGIKWPESWGALEPESASISEVDKVVLEQIKENNG